MPRQQSPTPRAASGCWLARAIVLACWFRHSAGCDPTKTPWNANRGFSLIEQALVLAIAGILTGIALPPLHHVLSRNRLQAAQSDFVASLRHTRSTAAITGKRTLFCPSADGSRCIEYNRLEPRWLLGHVLDGDHQPDGQ